MTTTAPTERVICPDCDRSRYRLVPPNIKNRKITRCTSCAAIARHARDRARAATEQVTP